MMQHGCTQVAGEVTAVLHDHVVQALPGRCAPQLGGQRHAVVPGTVPGSTQAAATRSTPALRSAFRSTRPASLSP
jgi:hypothetical protein